MKRIILLTFLLMNSLAFSQISSIEFESAKLNGSRKLTIITPEKYDKKQKYPLIVVLNAHRLLETTVSSVRYLTQTGELPPSIIVGIYNNDQEVIVPEKVGVPFDDSAKFFDFVAQEVLPYMHNKYNVGDFKTIISDGYAANLVHFYLLKEVSLFDAYVSLNPIVDPNTIDPIKNQVGMFKKSIFYYLGWTENDDSEIVRENQNLDYALKGIDSQNLFYYRGEYTKVSPDAIAPIGIVQGLNLIFSRYQPITMKEYNESIIKLQVDIGQYLEDKYQVINRLYKIDKKPLLNDIKIIYNAILKNQDWDSLPILSNFVRKPYKGTALSDFFEGEYFNYTDNPKRAFKSYQQAFSLSEIDFVTKEFLGRKLEESQLRKK